MGLPRAAGKATGLKRGTVKSARHFLFCIAIEPAETVALYWFVSGIYCTFLASSGRVASRRVSIGAERVLWALNPRHLSLAAGAADSFLFPFHPLPIYNRARLFAVTPPSLNDQTVHVREPLLRRALTDLTFAAAQGIERYD